MKTAIIPGFVLIEVEKTETLHADDYVQWHLWFLAPLLTFLTALALHTVLRRRPPQQAAPATPKGVLFALAATWLISACIMTAAIHTLPEWSWITVGGVPKEALINHFSGNAVELFVGEEQEKDKADV